MIVRIQGEGQWELDDGEAAELNQLDEELLGQINRRDEANFSATLQRLLSFVSAAGRALQDEEIRESDLILPPADATLDEVAKVFADEGLVAG